MTWAKGTGGWPRPHIENAALTGRQLPSLRRLELWRQARITVHGRPDWVFIKLHCHGMDPRDEASMYGEPMRRFLAGIAEKVRVDATVRVHYVTAREMVNITLAACDGREGNPGDYRDYRLQPIESGRD